MAPTKEAQDIEAANRAKADINPAEQAYASEGSEVDQGAPPADPATRQATPPADDAQRAAPPFKSPFQDKRNEIISRFRQDRNAPPEGEAVDQDQMNDFVRSGMPPEFAENNAPVAEPPAAEPRPEVAAEAAEPEAPAETAPRKFVLKVHGKEVELGEDEVIAKAQIALASDNILDAAKAKMKEIDDFLAQSRDRVQRADPSAQHQGRQESTQTTEPAPASTPPSDQKEKLAKLIETIQFGDPGEASALLQNTIDEAVTQATTKTVTTTLQSQRLKDEGARSQKVLSDFLESHADLASDPMAQAAIERKVYDLQVEDLQALGVDPSKLPTPNGRPVTPADVAQAHLWYRAEGYRVRPPSEMLETATKAFLDWRGVGTQAPKPADPAPGPKGQQQKVVEVTVDRSARRAAIPQTPSRTVTPRPDPASQQPAQRRDGSSIVAGMNARRSLPKGKVGISA